MSDFLQQHAIQNVWCTPAQDRQAIIKPIFFQKVRGLYERIDIAWDSLDTPSRDDYYVYQIGHYPPALFGLNGVVNQWKTLSELSSNSKCSINIYNGDGILIPLFESFLIQLENKTVLLAIKADPKIDPSKGDLFFHHYTNAFWSSNRANDEEDFWVKGIRRVRDNEPAVLAIYNDYYRARILGKRPQFIHNGYLVDRLPPNEILVGDYIEVRVDESISEVVDFDVDELSFDVSTMDQVRKYIVDLGLADTIRYHDDLEFRVCRLEGETNRCVKGLLLHRNQPSNVRMIASSSYSVSVDQVEHLRLQIGQGSCHLRVFVRRAGWHRPLIYENSRLHELNKLPKEKRHDIITGKMASCSLWTLTALERSAYPKVMRLPKIDDTTTVDLLRCYGYNSIAYYGARNIAYPEARTGVFQVFIPTPYRDGSAVEYDASGAVKAVKPCKQQGVLYTENGTVLVEFFEDRLLENCTDYYNTQSVPANRGEYRFYHRLKGTQDWMDITASVKWSAPSDGNIQHDYSSRNHEWVVRHSGWGWRREIETGLRQGVVEISLLDDNGTVELPFGKVVVSINGHELVQDIDYVIRRQTIWVSVKKYLNEGGTNKVVVTATGFPVTNSSGIADWGKPDRIGWTDHGLVDHNDRYNLHTGILSRVVVDGKLADSEKVSYHEDSNGKDGIHQNGVPYSISLVKPRLQALGIDPSTEKGLRTDAEERDKLVSDFMTVHYEIPAINRVSSIKERYQMYSIFTARILDDINNGLLKIPTGRLLDESIKALVKRYEFLLEMDAAYTKLNGAVDEGLVGIRPHTKNTLVSVPQHIYAFMDRLSIIYLGGLVDMTGHLAITLE